MISSTCGRLYTLLKRKTLTDTTPVKGCGLYLVKVASMGGRGRERLSILNFPLKLRSEHPLEEEFSHKNSGKT